MRHVLSLDDSYYDFTLIAIEALAEDSQIAFLLNKYLNIRLKREDEDLSFPQRDSEAKFSVFTYEDDDNDWFLVSNVFNFIYSIGMFNDFNSKENLIPEHEKVKLFLKIEGFVDEVELLKLLSNIPIISATYLLDPHSLNSKEYLIF